MQAIQKLTFKFNAFIALVFLPFSAFAGSPSMVVNTSMAPTSVPTLSGTMLIVLSLLLFAVAVRVTKQKNSGINKMFVTLLGVGSLSLVTGGTQLVSKADAALHGPLIDEVILLGSMLGERTVDLSSGSQPWGAYNLFTNQTPGVNVEIVRIIDGEMCGDTPANTVFTDEPDLSTEDMDDTIRTLVPDNQTCASGVVLGNGASCDLYCTVPIIE